MKVLDKRSFLLLFLYSFFFFFFGTHRVVIMCIKGNLSAD